ncbi:hypothetical protein ENUP19_0170G0024 [Entamoeba nuttalli]|uniref:Protein kinase domain-containing protein n=1 Tax=Entamoeba nuttalli TaxID=412467 RepID=A0ABQ0DMP6_9EUKA
MEFYWKKVLKQLLNMFDEISVLSPELKESAQYLYFEMGGSFGQVRKVFDMTSKEIRAIKIMKNKPNKKYKENEIVQSLHHQNIVTTYESYQIGEIYYYCNGIFTRWITSINIKKDVEK